MPDLLLHLYVGHVVEGQGLEKGLPLLEGGLLGGWEGGRVEGVIEGSHDPHPFFSLP